MTIFTLSLLAVSCIDNDYDLSDIDTDDIGICLLYTSDAADE